MELIELLKKIESQHDTLSNSSLVISDHDLNKGLHSLEEVDIHSVRLTLEDMKYSSACEYYGKLGYKILKCRFPHNKIPETLPRITREELGITYI